MVGAAQAHDHEKTAGVIITSFNSLIMTKIENENMYHSTSICVLKQGTYLSLQRAGV